MKPCFSNPPSRWLPQAAPGWADPLILFDGVCVLCTSWTRFIIRHDAVGRFRFVSIQSPQGRRLAEIFGIDPDNPQTNATILDGVAYFKSDAALMVMRHLRGMRWTQALTLVPRGLRNRLYDLIARNRYAWFGRHEACLLPTPELAARLLDRSEPEGSP
jgi:predicted DCC family thiol-disulfide oxidoreductase YuxK